MPMGEGPPGIAIILSKKMSDRESSDLSRDEEQIGADMARDLSEAMSNKDWKEAGRMFVEFVNYAMK